MAKAETELGIRHLQVREHEGLPANLQKLGRGKEDAPIGSRGHTSLLAP